MLQPSAAVGWHMRQCWQDLVYALRVLRKSPGYTVTATLIIAIAIGANVALFTAVKAVIINPLPFPEPSRLVALHESVPLFSASGGPLSTIEFNLLRGRVQSLTDMGAYESVSGELSDVASPTTISMAKVTSGLLEV